MPSRFTFAEVLNGFITRSRYSSKTLADLSGVSKRTIENWRAAEVTRPRVVDDLLRIAAALRLDAIETTELLQEANHASIEELLTQARRDANESLLQLLEQCDILAGTRAKLPQWRRSFGVAEGSRVAPDNEVMLGNRIRVLILENFEPFRTFLERELAQSEDIEVIGSFSSPRELLTWIEHNSDRVDADSTVAVLDVVMDELPLKKQSQLDPMNGVDVAVLLRKKFTHLPIVLYSTWMPISLFRKAEDAMFSNAFALIRRDSPSAAGDRFSSIIRKVQHGESYIAPELRVSIDLDKIRERHSPSSVIRSEDQWHLFELLAQGFNNDEIAAQLKKTQHDVEEGIKRIYQVLELSDVLDANSRRIRASKMYIEDRLLRWHSSADGALEIFAQDRNGNWQPLDKVKEDEQYAREYARLIESKLPYTQ